jgi:hypothetical protein
MKLNINETRNLMDGAKDAFSGEPYILQTIGNMHCMFVRDDVAEKLLKSSKNTGNLGSKQYAQITDTTFSMVGSSTKYKARVYILSTGGYGGSVPDGYGYQIAASSGTYGSGGFARTKKEEFSNKVRDQIFQAASKYIDSVIK